MRISLMVNGQAVEAQVQPRMLLVHFLREALSLTGTQVGCDTTTCGACTVLIDGLPVKCCGLFAVQADGREITTVEGLAPHGHLHPVQESFKECHAVQCGFCTPGMMLAAIGLLRANADPSEDEIRAALAGNMCRCTGYTNIVRAVQQTARRLHAAAPTPAGVGSMLAATARPPSRDGGRGGS